ncbi:hypothetical protein KFL_012480010, partial [Klebsormidium nitens]
MWDDCLAKTRVRFLPAHKIHTIAVDKIPQDDVMYKLRTVKPLEKGMGAPYAPEGWGWKVGKRVGKDGCYVDRYWFPPGAQMLSSSKEVKAFLADKHPDWVFEEFVVKYKSKIPAALQETQGDMPVISQPVPYAPASSEAEAASKAEVGTAAPSARPDYAPLPELFSEYPPVPVGAKGVGRPYAPDGWVWGVGQRVKPDGTFADRYLWPPGASGTQYVASTVALERWLAANRVNWDVLKFWEVYKKWIPAIVPQGDPGDAEPDARDAMANHAETSAAGSAKLTPRTSSMSSSRGRPLHSSHGDLYDYGEASPSPEKPRNKRARSSGTVHESPARSSTPVSIKDILSKWQPPAGQPYFPAVVLPNRNWHEHLPPASEGALFVGQCVFLRSSEGGELSPYVVRVTEILVNHPEGKVAAGYAFYRQSDIRQIEGCETFESEDILGELFVSFERMEFSADEIEGPTVADPYFWADQDDMHYK